FHKKPYFILWYSYDLEVKRFIQDGLFKLGKSLIGDNPSQSLIFVSIDAHSYIQNNIFTANEIEEIINYKKATQHRLLEDLKQYINTFNCSSAVDIRKALTKSQA
ncbi:hypothetical protein BCV71DRAFT_32263, partial [Rhizopus microsporus]